MTPCAWNTKHTSRSALSRQLISHKSLMNLAVAAVRPQPPPPLPFTPLGGRICVQVCRSAEWALGTLWAAVKPQGAAFRRERPDPLALLVESNTTTNHASTSMHADDAEPARTAALVPLGKDSAVRALVEATYAAAAAMEASRGVVVDGMEQPARALVRAAAAATRALEGLRMVVRLPKGLNWGGLFWRLLRAGDSDQCPAAAAAAPLQAMQVACVRWAVAHMGCCPALAGALDALLSLPRFAPLPLPLRATLLRSLSTVLPELGAEHAAEALHVLPVAVASDSKLASGASPRTALWEALGELAQRAQQTGQLSPGVTMDGLEAAASVLLDGLCVDADTCAQLARRLAAAQHDSSVPSPSGQRATEETEGVDSAVVEWEHALHAMAAMGKAAAARLSTVHTTTDATAGDPQGGGRRAAVCCVARCGLVSMRHLRTEDAVSVREWCLGIDIVPSTTAHTARTAALLTPLAAAVAATSPPHAERVQWLLDTAAAAATCPRPSHALALLSLLAAAWGPHVQCLVGGAQDGTLTVPLNALSGVLPALLQRQRWREAAPSVAAVAAAWLRAHAVTSAEPATYAAAAACVLALRRESRAAGDDTTTLIDGALERVSVVERE